MYYRVASFKKNDDFREMIVRVSSKEEAKKQLPAAKEFLFPGEDTTDYWCQIFPVPIKVNLGTTIPHYRIRVTRPAKAEKTPEDWEDIDRGYDAITQAESAEQAKEKGRQMLVEDGEDPDAYEVYVDEMTVEECIREEERSLHRTITNAYLHLQDKDNLSVREYNNFCRHFNIDKDPEQYYEALKAFNRYLWLIHITAKQCDRTNCTVEKLFDTAERLYHCNDREEFSRILETVQALSDTKNRGQ